MKQCFGLPPRKNVFEDLGGGFSSNTECLLLAKHAGPHLSYIESRDKYVAWEMIDEASDMKDICEECPWASDENLATSTECDCIYYGEISKLQAKKFINQGFVERNFTGMCDR
jgi:hypothetical protein